MTMLVAFMSEPKRSVSHSIYGIIIACLLNCMATNIANATLSPNLAAHFIYPYYTFVRYISLAEFIEKLDALIIATWYTGVFIKLSVCKSFICQLPFHLRFILE
jgi:spore germination protein KB